MMEVECTETMLFEISDRDGTTYVEAPSMVEAIAVWKKYVEDAEDDEFTAPEPSSVVLITSDGVVRAKSCSS